MTRECSRAVLHLSPDERLVAGIGGAIAHFAERAGLDEGTSSLLVAALEGVCRQTLPLLEKDQQTLDVAIEDFGDRLEIVFEHHGQPQPSVGVESFFRQCSCQTNGSVLGSYLMRTVDKVEYDGRNGSIRTKVVKYLSGNGRS